MAKVVYKYPLPMTDRFTIALPIGAQSVYTAMQGQQAMLWALVDPERVSELRHFRLAGTGHPIEGEVTYVGTLHVDALVFHLFEDQG